jgi:hypothetical protein
MARRPEPTDQPSKQTPNRRSFTAADVRRMLSDPAYGYGVNLQPVERATEAVMQLDQQLAQKVRESGVTFTLDDLDQRFQALLKQLEDSGVCHRGEDLPPIVTKEQWLQAQWAAIQRLARGEAL